MKNVTLLIIVFSAVPACSKGPKSAACDAAALAKIADSSGKEIALTGCTFASQGNDVVAFTDTSSGSPSIDCKMKGGEAAVTAFRHAAMALDMKKLRLDVHGTVSGKDALKDCEISAHE